MTGATYDGFLGLLVQGRVWHRTQSPPLSLTVIEKDDRLLVMPSDQSGGLRGGDRVHTEVEVVEGWVDWRPPSSSLFFPSRDRAGTCTVTTRLVVGAAGRLSWEPPVAIPCAGARIDQCVELHAEPGAEMLYWDGWSDGRTSSGERGAFSSLANHLVVNWGGRVVFRERWTLEDMHKKNLDPAGFQGACQWHLAIAAGPESIAVLKKRIERWQEVDEAAEWGEVGDGIVIGRVLAQRPRGPQLQGFIAN